MWRGERDELGLGLGMREISEGAMGSVGKGDMRALTSRAGFRGLFRRLGKRWFAFLIDSNPREI